MNAQIPHVGILIASTREGRFGERPARWLHELASRRTDLSFELIDLRDHPLPFFNEPAPPLWAPSQNPAAQRWAALLARLDGLIIVTPEYNHGVPAVLKNALDYVYREYCRKPVAFLGYGGVGAARAIEHLRGIVVELQMAPLRHAVHIGLMEFRGILMEGKTFADYPHLAENAGTMLDDLAWWARALKQARSPAH